MREAGKKHFLALMTDPSSQTHDQRSLNDNKLIPQPHEGMVRRKISTQQYFTHVSHLATCYENIKHDNTLLCQRSSLVEEMVGDNDGKQYTQY